MMLAAVASKGYTSHPADEEVGLLASELLHDEAEADEVATEDRWKWVGGLALFCFIVGAPLVCLILYRFGVFPT